MTNGAAVQVPRVARGARNAPVIGETHGHDHITKRIGAGGMGEVYRATDTKLKRLLLAEPAGLEAAASPLSVLVNWPAVLAER